MRVIATVTLLAILVLSSACGWLCGSKGGNTGSSLATTVVAVAVPRDMIHGQRANWSAAWEGGNGPYTIEWDFGGGADNIGPLAATSPDHQSPLMINEDPLNPATYVYTVTVVDSAGEEGFATGSYEVAPYLNRPPELELSLDNHLLTALVFDVDGDDLTVTITTTPGITSDPQSVTVTGGTGTAEFFLQGINLFAAASGTATVTVDDGRGGVTTKSIEVEFAAIAVQDNTVYVVPLKNRARVGEAVRFVCFTGTLPNPFRYLNAVSITIEEDGEYVPNSLNVGALGGATDYPDGIWPNVGVDEFLLADELIVGVSPRPDLSIPEGRKRWQFNVTGLGGSDLAGGSGMLFNFAMTFSAAGEKRLGLQQFDLVKRTYYTDGASTEYYFGGLMADQSGILHVEGVDNSVIVE